MLGCGSEGGREGVHYGRVHAWVQNDELLFFSYTDMQNNKDEWSVLRKGAIGRVDRDRKED